MSSTRRAVWVARSDTSAYVYGTELDALRHAVDSGMEVVKVPHGENVLTYQPEEQPEDES